MKCDDEACTGSDAMISTLQVLIIDACNMMVQEHNSGMAL
jgi:hypothetical protein